MLAAARAKAKAKMAAPTPSEGVRRPAGIHYARLKAYAADLRKEGLPQLAHHLVTHPGELPEVMDQLNEETRIQDSEPSEDMLESNRKVFTQGTTKIELLKMTKDFCAEELVGRCTERGVCHITNGLTAYCNIIDMVTPVNESTAFSLKFDQYSILGGWADPSNYDVCRLPAGASFEREEQNRVVFALGKGSSVEKFVAAAQLQIFTGKIADTLDNIYGTKNTPHKVAEMHVCFGFSAYVNYGYHKDALDLKSEVDLTFMLMLSPGRSSMRVAGAKKESFYEYPGDMLYFDAVDVYHRSGLACARTLKIAFFVKLTGSAPVPIDSGGDGGGSSSSTKMDKQVKQELVKKEPKVEGELEGEEEEPAAVVADTPKEQIVSMELKLFSSASPSVQGGAAAPLAAATDNNPPKEDDDPPLLLPRMEETEVVAAAPPQEMEEKKHESARDPPASSASGEVVVGAAPPATGAAPDISSTVDAVPQESSAVGEVVPPAAQAAPQAVPQEEDEKKNTDSDSSNDEPVISSVEGAANEEMDTKESMEEGGGSPKVPLSSGKKRTRQASQSGSELQGEDGTPSKGSQEIKVKQEGTKPDPKPKKKSKTGK